MKKIITLLLVAVMSLSLVACAKADVDEEKSSEMENYEQTEVELDIPVGDYFTITEACYTTKQQVGDKVSVRLKFRNDSDTTFTDVSFQYHCYDKNGDKVNSQYADVSDMEVGHATWSGYIHTDMTLDDFGSIKIEYFSANERTGDTVVQSGEKVFLDPKPEILIEQMAEKD